MACRLGIPVVVTAEHIKSVGTTIPFITEVLPDGPTEHDKMTFGLGGDPLIVREVESIGECHQAGISRMRDAGAVISTVKGTF
jgi:dihydroxyacid dehydratase/phosphogluconate dehydratase